MFSCGGRACDSLVQQLPLMDAAALARSASTSYLLILLAAIVAELQGRLQDEASSDEWQLPDGSSGRFAGASATTALAVKAWDLNSLKHLQLPLAQKLLPLCQALADFLVSSVEICARGP